LSRLLAHPRRSSDHDSALRPLQGGKVDPRLQRRHVQAPVTLRFVGAAQVAASLGSGRLAGGASRP
jgi:hypothetical protein